jgi:hypothetical protein
MATSDGAGRELPGPDGSARRGWRPGDDLWPLEVDMLRMAEAGERVDLAEGPSDLAMMKAIRAEVLRHLLLDGDWPVHAKGMRLRWVRISGRLDLEAATLRCPLRLENCYLDDPRPVILDYATVTLLTITGCRLAGLAGDTLIVTKELDLSSSTFTGPLRLADADINGQFVCRGAQLTAADRDGYALVAYRMKVGADVFLDGGFTAAGAVRLPDADITGSLVCRGAQLTAADRDGYALVADRMRVGGNVFLDGGFNAAGAVRLPGADINGQFACGGAKLVGVDGDGNALFAEGMKVGADVALNHGFNAVGTVRLSGADITRQLAFGGAKLTGADGDGFALVAEAMKVGGDVLLNGEFTADGTVSLRSARVDGSLWLRPGKLAGDKGKIALDATGARIARKLGWAPSEQVVGLVSFEDAAIGQLEDDWTQDGGRANGYWPSDGRLRLDGFTYTSFGGNHKATIEQRLAWIRSQYKSATKDSKPVFAAQPYEQLAKVYGQTGHDTEARRVAIARRRDLRRYGDLTRSRKAGNWLLDFTIRYGYQTWRAVVGLAALFVVILVIFWLAQYRTGLIVPAQATYGLHPAPTAARCISHYPCFSPVGYTIDTVIPLINVHQADYWRPNASAAGGWLLVYVTWAGIGLGWALGTLVVAGYTGLARNIYSP